MPRDLIGQTLLNQFRVDRYIASGGMATIYQVWDLQRSVSLAMKVLQPELAQDPSFIARFQREASSLQRLVHPNIVPFFGLYQSEEETFLLERHIDGPSLDDVLRSQRGKPMPLLNAMIFCKALFSSVGYAHAQGIIHCDIKPGNVLIDKGGAVYLTDFGIARYMDSSVTTSAVMGTPLYMAPEQVQGAIASRQTDIYSLGIVLFELLTGRRPFRGDGNLPSQAGNSQVERIRYQQVFQLPPDPRQFNAQIPAGLAAAVLKALAKDPRDRYPTVQAMAAEISWAIGARFESLPDRVDLGMGDSRIEIDPNGFSPVANYWPPENAGGRSSSMPLGEDVSAPRKPAFHPSRRILTILVIVSLTSICALAVGGLIRAAGLGILPKMTPLVNATPTNGVIGSTPVSNDSQRLPDSPSVGSPTSGATTESSPGLIGVTGDVIIVENSGNKDRLFSIDLGNGNRAEIPDVANVNVDLAQAPQWSPDGSHLAWVSRYDGKSHITVMDVIEREPYQIPAGEAFQSVSAPAWRADGRRLSFWAHDGSEIWLITVDVTTGESQEQVKLPEYRNLFSWNPRNDLVAFVRQRFNLYEVVISSSITSEEIPIESGGEEYAPAWSPDGEWLAFQSDAGRGSGENEIWVIGIDGSNLRQVTNSPDATWSRAPTWSPDGQWIAYVSNQAGSRGADYGELFVVEVRSGAMHQMTNTGGQVYDWRPAWRPR